LAYSGILGSLIPPSISGLIFAVVVGLPIFGVWFSVAGAGLLYILMLLITNYIYCRKKGYESSINRTKDSSKTLYKTFIKALPAIAVPIGLLGSIYGGVATPTTSTLLVSARQTAVIMFLICGSFSLSYALTVTGSVKVIGRSMLLLTDNKYMLILITEVLLLILGCFLDDTPIMILLGPLAYAILIPVGVHPYHLAAIFVSVCLIGLVTPPVGLVLYASSAISGLSVSSFLKEILIFFIPAIITILLITFFPQISFFLPKILGLM